jgi:hypothetical protein
MGNFPPVIRDIYGFNINLLVLHVAEIAKDLG